MAQPVTYDQAVIVKFAAQLYARVKSIVIGYSLLGALLVFAGSTVAFRSRELMGEGSSNSNVQLIGAAVGLFIGYLIGSEKAFALRPQAQTALCQAQIEVNTRSAAVSARAPINS